MIIDIFTKFSSISISKAEFESIIFDTIKQEFPKDTIKSIIYTDFGVVVDLSAYKIEIEIDWNEINLKE